jgi:hypothetical protein
MKTRAAEMTGRLGTDVIDGRPEILIPGETVLTSPPFERRLAGATDPGGRFGRGAKPPSEVYSMHDSVPKP